MLKNKLSKTMKWLIAFIMVFSLLTFTGVNEVNAAYTSTKKTTLKFNGYIKFKKASVGNFTIDGKQAFCLAHKKATPKNNAKLTNKVYNNKNVQKCLYYGYGGPAQWSGFKTKAQGVVVTSLLLSHYYSGDKIHTYTKDFYNYIKNKTVPDYSVIFSKSSVTAYKSGKIQRTPSVTLNSGSTKYSISFTLQKGVTYVDETHNKKQSSGTVKVYGKTKFHFEAPLDKDYGTWSTGKKACKYAYLPIVSTSTSTVQSLGQGQYVTDPQPTTSLSVKWLKSFEKGSVNFIKTGEVLSDYNEDKQEFEYEERGLKGIHIQVFAKNDIVDPQDNSTVIYKKDQLVKELVTDDDGNAMLNDLVVGDYYAKEVSTTDGYTLNNDVKEFSVKVDSNGQSIDIDDIEFKNIRQKFDIHIIKKTEQTKKPIKGVIFGLYAKNDIKDYDGNVIVKAGQLIKKSISNEKGEVDFGLDVPAGEYYQQEISTPDNILMDSTKFDVSVKIKNDTTEIFTINRTVYNTLLDDVDITKYDATNKQELEGAYLVLRDSQGNIVDQWISSKIAHRVKLKVNAYYTLEETIAPQGYQLSSKIKFKVEDNGEIVQKVNMYDELKPVIKITKTPQTGDQQGEMIYILLASMSLSLLGVFYYMSKKSIKKALFGNSK